MFNHYLVKRSLEGADKCEPVRFPINLVHTMMDGLALEEVTCKKRVTKESSKYYKNVVARRSKEITMISVVTGDYKSPCFNAACCLVKIPFSAAPPDSIFVESSEEGMIWVLSIDLEVDKTLLVAICELGLSPIVNTEGTLALELKGASRYFVVNFANTDCTDYGPNVIACPGVGKYEGECKDNKVRARAVMTALATVSVVLTPKSMHGGKNPTTKQLKYFVHNILHGSEL